MTGGAALVLCSAILHATWNALLKREPRPEVAVLGVMLSALACAAAAAALWPGALLGSRAGLAWAVGAGVLEGLYFATLAAALARASYGAAYAVARGGALVLVWPASVLLLREPASARAAAGAAVVLAGVVLVAVAGRERASRGGIAFAAASAASIAGYHVCYDRALVAGAAPAPLFALALAVALPIAWGAARLGGPLTLAPGRAALVRWAAAGALATLAFLLFLRGLGATGAGVGLTLRNASVPFAQLLALAMGERVPLRQAGGALLVVAGTSLAAGG